MTKKSESGGGKRGWLSTQRRARGAGRAEGSASAGASDYRKQIRANKRARKNGCSSKLFMLVLPMIAVGAYLILGS